ncbi:mannose-1-phosphate guanylyltransferase [Bifidobacterium sp. ESL0790]|uniref:mannose-1-phosphate guanylyltransferase n=1 Tax=Bifidobacterium sp. ESL0790 TaxID=2983233 RepID=UPI0023F82991|nr:mannose-1-phosphate guanylyltransferase [Bifidobacterium sp. ESL0790]WEV73147.1 mannose-1-phosphate guanylyltransferase [Bifidobacterium sp. ESL0790]
MGEARRAGAEHAEHGDFEDFYAIIPAGGTGSRLWPLSRGARPKFLFDLMGSGSTLIQSTFARLARLTGPDHIVVSTGWRHVAEVEAQLPDLAESNIFAEPVPRDSTAAIALATAILARRHGDHIVVGSFAADHVIRGKETFAESVRQAVAVARAGYVTTIGIAASRPSTAFGYIHQGRSLAGEVAGAPSARLVERFVEKPDSATAQAYLSTGEYRWNAGMFIMRADVLLDHLREYKPQLFDAILHIADAYAAEDEAEAKDAENGGNGKQGGAEGLAALPLDYKDTNGDGHGDGDSDTSADAESGSDINLDAVDEAMAKYWPGIEKVAFDYAVAEPLSVAGGVAMVPGDFGWDDIGDFNSVAALLPSTGERNIKILGDTDRVVSIDSAGDVVMPLSERTIALLGVNDMVVADTPDALLIAPRARSQEVKDMVTYLDREGRDDIL